MKRFIVTGGYGFIGSNLIRLLLKKKFKVLNIDNLSYSAQRYNLKGIKKNYAFKKTDINNKKEILNIFNRFRPHGIFNLAADTHVDRSIDNSFNFIKNNILGVYNLLEAIKEYKNKIRLVHISTDEVYGDISGKKRSDEDFPYMPSSPYSATKASSDHLISAYVRTHRIDAVISNCSNNYGPRQFPEKLIPKMIFNILNNNSLPIYAKGKNSREWIFVDDHCEALIKLFFNGKTGEKYNIGSGQNYNNIFIVKKILKIFKKKKIKIGKKVKIKYVKDRPGHDFRYALNSKKIRKKIKWRPKINFNKGITETIDWYIDNQQYLNKISKKLFVNRLGKK
ncbi:MAG: dTDP-glucose 4,6-dehydratase [Pelagibacteraceae bacterium]|nr:dTDP-glucose 4,6-dehydratase [Pelagibacteraceae bacterium]|tara:strand:+ start:9453 stop:10463 length:1011 start_codon:yes stop_codon:yes gene_type:complete